MGIKRALLSALALSLAGSPALGQNAFLRPQGNVVNLTHNPIVTETNFSNVQLSPRCDGGIGRIQRTERWSPIIKAVEDKYGIPRNTLYAIVMQESCGDPVQPNATGDGGIGLIHMQPGTATWLGLDIYGKSKTTGKDYKHGKSLRNIIETCRYDTDCILEYDDRAHPIKNLDAMGRYLSFYKEKKGWDGAVRMVNPGQRSYLSKINGWKKKIANRGLEKAAEDFNGKNSGKTINGQPLTFDLYINEFHKMNKNYGLEEYKRK